MVFIVGATPERAEFEASIDQDSESPSIMDEDEWTDRNFGGNSLIIINDEEDNNTSEDRYSFFKKLGCCVNLNMFYRGGRQGKNTSRGAKLSPPPVPTTLTNRQRFSHRLSFWEGSSNTTY